MRIRRLLAVVTVVVVAVVDAVLFPSIRKK